MDKRILATLPLALLLSTACAPELDSNVEPVAQFYFERLVDSLRLDTTLAFRESVPYDTTALDSLTSGWSETEWTQFWRLVQEKQVDHRSSAVNAAGE